MEQRIRLMTHNVWDSDENTPAWAEKGEDCSAAVRVKGLVRVYRETEPDVIGGQEFSPLMVDLLKEGLSAEGKNYTLIWGRCTPILYRPDKLDLVDSEFCTFPEKVPGFEGEFNNAKTKSYCLGVFRIKANGEKFIFVTTHLWWKKSPTDAVSFGNDQYLLGSDEAREYQIASVLERIEKYREKYHCPAVLVGDMNCPYPSLAMKYVRSKGFRHAHDIAVEFAEEAVGYHYCYPDGYEKTYYDGPFETAIDHIYVIGEKENAVKRFERYSPEYYFPISDHSPAFMDIEV